MNETKSHEEIKRLKDLFLFIRKELKPKGKIFTPFNVISFPIILLGALLILLQRTGIGHQPFSRISLGDLDRV